MLRYYHLAKWQLTSPTGLLALRRNALLQEEAYLETLLLGMNQPRDLSEVDEAGCQELRDTRVTYPTTVLKDASSNSVVLPLTLGGFYDRIDDLLEMAHSLEAQIRMLQRRGTYVDVGPLMDFFRTPPDKREGIDIVSFCPPNCFLLKLQSHVDVNKALAWRHQAQRVNSHTSDGSGGEPGMSLEDAGKPAKRSFFSKVMGR